MTTIFLEKIIQSTDRKGSFVARILYNVLLLANQIRIGIISLPKL